MINVGQGDSTLVLGPTGRSLLIDVGPAGSGPRILSLLENLEIDRPDWILMSHYDADHVGGLRDVLSGPDTIIGTDDDVLPEEGLLDRGEPSGKNIQAYLGSIEEAGSFRTTIPPGLVLDLGDGATAEVLVVNGAYADGTEVSLDSEENEFSSGLLIRYGDFRYFTDGDLTGGGTTGAEVTRDLETHAGELAGDLDILHVSHHGSATGTPQDFLEIIRPEAAVISVGKDNDYGHPAPSVLYRLEQAGIEVYRTDQMGSILIETDGNDYWLSQAP